MKNLDKALEIEIERRKACRPFEKRNREDKSEKKERAGRAPCSSKARFGA